MTTTPGDEASPRPRPPATAVLRPLAVGIAATTVVALPTLLVGGLAVLIQDDLGFGEQQLGVAVAASFAAGAVVAIPAGRMAERIGPRRTTWRGLAFALASLLGIGFVVREWVTLVVFLVFAGIAVTTVQLGVNVLLARAISPRRQGLAFGVKQAAVPLASLMAGLALPVIGLTLGWQAAFLLGALLVPVVLYFVPDARGRRRNAGAGSKGGSPTPALILLMIGVALASAGGNSTAAFTVPSAVDRGLEPSLAGLVLAVGSFVGIIVRGGAGWVADRLGRGSLLLVVGLIAVGAVGFVGLAFADHPLLIVLCTMLAFGGGWGWGGLILLALTRTNPDAPGRAMGIVQMGPTSGAVVGPLLFGTLAEHIAFGAAWTVMAGLALLGLVTILVARHLLLRGTR